MNPQQTRPYLPTPFTAPTLWVIALQDTLTSEVVERWALADEGAAGLAELRHAIDSDQMNLVMAMSLDQVERFETLANEHEAHEGVWLAKPLAENWERPTWANAPLQPFAVAWANPGGPVNTTWVQANTGGEALLAFHQEHPTAVILSVGSPAALKEQRQSLEQCLEEQDFGKVAWDFRTRVSHPATSAHSEGYLLAQAGMYPTTHEGMLASHALFLNDMEEEETSRG